MTATIRFQRCSNLRFDTPRFSIFCDANFCLPFVQLRGESLRIEAILPVLPGEQRSCETVKPTTSMERNVMFFQHFLLNLNDTIDIHHL